MVAQRRIVVLGSTGSIGVSTLDVAARHPERFSIVALTAHHNIDELFKQCARFRPRAAVVARESDAQRLALRLRDSGVPTEVGHGAQELERVAALPDADTVMAAIVGIAGLRPTLAAVRAGKRVLLANKEALVTAGPLFMQALRASGAVLLPIDSEHNAVFQVLPSGFAGDLAGSGVRRIVLTASGGPFREWPLDRLADVTPDQACAHPNWVMGRKISVDSATMMNKGLEVIEACWLFNAREDQVDTIIHPESVIHSLVEYRDGSVLAQLGNPDMRTPISHALGFPERIDSGVSFLNLAAVSKLSFMEPDPGRFPCLRLARGAMRAGGAAPAVLNAANEVAVAAFLDGQLQFDRIPALIEAVLAASPNSELLHLDDVTRIDEEARTLARQLLAREVVKARRHVRVGNS